MELNKEICFQLLVIVESKGISLVISVKKMGKIESLLNQIEIDKFDASRYRAYVHALHRALDKRGFFVALQEERPRS